MLLARERCERVGAIAFTPEKKKKRGYGCSYSLEEEGEWIATHKKRRNGKMVLPEKGGGGGLCAAGSKGTARWRCQIASGEPENGFSERRAK